jgi:hypothetical protein
MTTDVPNTFVQTNSGIKKDGERIIMKIKGALVDMFVELDSHTYKEHVSFKNGSKILFVNVQKKSMGCCNQLYFSIKN